MTEQTTLDHLNMLLQGEISACETYKQALDKIENANAKQILQKNHLCHSERAQELAEAVKKLGGEPATGSGIWGAFAKLMEGGAKVLGDKAAVSVLEEGEDKGLKDYQTTMDKVATSEFMAGLLAKQEASHAACRDLKKSMV